MMKKEEIKKRLLSDVEKLKAPQGYLHAGYPSFDTLFGRDSLIAALQMFDVDPQVARATLQSLAKHQGKIFDQKSEEEPGRILHEFARNPKSTPHWKFPYFGSVDATPLFVVVANEYFHKSNDRGFLLQIWDNIVQALDWMSIHGDADRDHFIEYERKNPHGLFHQGWRDSFDDHLKVDPPVAIVEAQGYAYAAYCAGANLAEKLGKSKKLLHSWRTEAEALRVAFHRSFWWEEETYYYLALDGLKRPRKSVSSNPGHLLFTGIVPEEVLQQFVKRLFNPDLFTPYGIRTVSEHDPDFDPTSYHLGSVWPHDNWIIYDGLKKLGFRREANRIKQALFSAYRELGHIPELFGVENGKIISLSGGSDVKRSLSQDELVRANPLQAWATCTLLNMIWED